MAKETVYGKYTYGNRVRGTVKQHIKEKIIKQAEATGVSESSIVAEALKEYFERRNPPQQIQKHCY